MLKTDNFLVNGDGKLVGHAGNKFDDALVKAVWLGQVEHWLDGVEFDVCSFFKIVAGVFYEPVFKGGAEQGILLEAEAHLLAGNKGLGLAQQSVDGVDNHCGVVLKFLEPPVVVNVGKVKGF